MRRFHINRHPPLRHMLLLRHTGQLEHGRAGSRALWRNGHQTRLMSRYSHQLCIDSYQCEIELDGYCIGGKVILATLPQGFLDNLPPCDVRAIQAALGRPVHLVGYDGFLVELEFSDVNWTHHTIWVDPEHIKPLPSPLSQSQ